MSQIKVTLVKGLAGSTSRQRLTVKGLGLSKIRQTVVLEDTPSIRGMVEKVSHLVVFEEEE